MNPKTIVIKDIVAANMATTNKSIGHRHR